MKKSSAQPVNVFDTTPRYTEKELEEVRTDLAMWATAIILLTSIVIIGGFSASMGLVFMIGALVVFAIYFALNG